MGAHDSAGTPFLCALGFHKTSYMGMKCQRIGCGKWWVFGNWRS